MSLLALFEGAFFVINPFGLQFHHEKREQLMREKLKKKRRKLGLENIEDFESKTPMNSASQAHAKSQPRDSKFVSWGEDAKGNSKCQVSQRFEKTDCNLHQSSLAAFAIPQLVIPQTSKREKDEKLGIPQPKHEAQSSKCVKRSILPRRNSLYSRLGPLRGWSSDAEPEMESDVDGSDLPQGDQILHSLTVPSVFGIYDDDVLWITEDKGWFASPMATDTHNSNLNRWSNQRSESRDSLAVRRRSARSLQNQQPTEVTERNLIGVPTVDDEEQSKQENQEKQEKEYQNESPSSYGSLDEIKTN